MSMPIGMDGKDIYEYVEEFLRPDHPEHHLRQRFGSIKIFNSASGH
jgi:hypothetical protein